MGSGGAIGELEKYLVHAALENRSSAEVLDTFVRRVQEAGVALSRAYVGWRLLHPLYMSQNIIFERERDGVAAERYRHLEGTRSADFLQSPLKHVLDSGLTYFRRRLVDPECPRDFPVLEEFVERGYTDYVIFVVSFGRESSRIPGAGMILTFNCDGADGFSDADIALLDALKPMLALAARSELETDMRQTLARTYLGRSAGARVLQGQVQRGEGQSIDAVVWYCDLRGSTHLCETMGVDDYLPFLNDYFSVTAGPVTAEGGEVLDFIGDAVLAIFPLDTGGIDAAMRATRSAVGELEAFRGRYHNVLGDRRTVADVAGIAIDIGSVMYGNIGIPERLTFSVIGPTVNKVSRIERLTKVLREPVLVTHTFAGACDSGFVSRGEYHLDGVTAAEEVFALHPRHFSEDGAFSPEPVSVLSGSHA